MALPSLIEIIPPCTRERLVVGIPGSKSITNRALILAALAKGTVRLPGALWSEDTEVMVEALRRLGFSVHVESDPTEPGNRLIVVEGRGGVIPRGGTAAKPLELFVGNAGTAARFLAALVCLGDGVFRLSGVPRMHQRPQAALLEALGRLGYRVESSGGFLPATLYGGGPRPGVVEVSVDESSQFASALLLSGRTGQWDVRVTGANLEELPYIEMTRRLMSAFPWAGGELAIEPDASSASYFWAGAALLGTALEIPRWPTTGWQVDAEFPRFLSLPAQVSRDRDLGDSIMTAMILAPFASHAVEFTDLARLRVQECERVVAMRTELGKCGVQVTEQGDRLTIEPGAPHGATIHTYEDHRIAMCFATLGLKVAGVRIENPSCVKKTFPNFFQKLTAPAPFGFGATVVDAHSRRALAGNELLPA